MSELQAGVQEVKVSSKMYRFIDWLGKLGKANNTQAYAVMRRALGQPRPEDYLPAAAYVESFLGKQTESDSHQPGSSREARIFYLIAGLYCLVNRAGEPPPPLEGYKPGQNFGWTIGRQHRDSFPQASETPSSMERRFLALMQSDEEQLVYFLRQMTTQVKEQAIDWVKLGEDLLRWQYDTTRRAWVQSFYRTYQDNNKQLNEKGITQ